MKITKLSEAQSIPFNLDGRIMSKSHEIEIIHLHLKPGEKLEKHRNPFDTVFYILEGNAIIITEEGKIETEPDMVIELSQTVERSVENNEFSDFRMLVIKKLHAPGTVL
jgi:mannose-6-phosphate isomerase-like protein (cupin superfamily)